MSIIRSHKSWILPLQYASGWPRMIKCPSRYIITMNPSCSYWCFVVAIGSGVAVALLVIVEAIVVIRYSQRRQRMRDQHGNCLTTILIHSAVVQLWDCNSWGNLSAELWTVYHLGEGAELDIRLHFHLMRISMVRDKRANINALPHSAMWETRTHNKSLSVICVRESMFS